MLARIRKAQEEREGGFTLIELLVVMIIIGILAAIAIPVFLNQRAKGWDSAVKSDLKNAATAQETYLTEENAYFDANITPAVITAGTLDGLSFSAAGNYADGDQLINVVAVDGQTYCLDATSASGEVWVYDSSAGGLQPKDTPACTP